MMRYLFPLLLGPLSERSKPLFDTSEHKQEDLDFVEGLFTALERDLANGMQPSAEQVQAWATQLTIELHPPRAEAKAAPLPSVDFALPDAAWREVAGDPRERLLARLVHLGADPWRVREDKGNGLHAGEVGNDNYIARYMGRHLAGTWLALGYSNLARLAMNMPHDDACHALKGPWRSYEDGHLTMFQEAVARDELSIVATMLKQGALVDGSLRHARSVPMVERLLDAGASLENGEVAKHWLAKRGARLARAMIQATQTMITPQARFKQALNGKPWGAIHDVLADWTGWEDETLTLGQAPLRLAAYAAATAERKNSHHVLHALRLIERQAPGEVEVLPGVSERAFVRLCLHALRHANIPDYRRAKSEAESAINTRLDERLVRLGGTPETLKSDALAFLNGARALYGTGCAHRIVNTWAGGMAAHYRDISRRTVEDTLLLGRAARCLWQGEPSHRMDDKAFACLFGMEKKTMESNNGYGKSHPSDPRRSWLPALIKKHPERIEEISLAAVQLLGAGLSARLYASSGDPWQMLCEQVDEMVGQGGLMGLTHQEAAQLTKIATDYGRSPQASALGAKLRSKLEQMDLDTHTPRAGGARQPRRF